jgi:predicted SprT family Zn-dependent metalloprotease
MGRHALTTEDLNKLVGQKFNFWTVLAFDGRKNLISNKSRYYQITYKCQCDCGAIKSVRRLHLLTGQSKSCRGCSAKRWAESRTK